MRGLAYLGKNDYDKVIGDFTQVISILPNDSLGYISRGGAYFRKEDFAKAIEDYTQAIKLKPDGCLNHCRGDAYYEKGDYDKAIKDYKRAIHWTCKTAKIFDPTGKTVFILTGKIHLCKGEYDQAIENFTQAIQAYTGTGKEVIMNDCDEAYYWCGRAHSCKGDINQTRIDYETILRHHKNCKLVFLAKKELERMEK